MHTADQQIADQQIAYLNDYFAAEIWRPAADLLGNLSLSQADDFVRTLPLCNGLHDSSFDFSQPPSATLLDDHTARFLIPGNGQHEIDTTIDVTDPLPNADLSVRFGLQIDASAGLPNSDVDVNVGFNWGGTISDILLGVLPFRHSWPKRQSSRASMSASNRHLETGSGIASAVC
jgi:hypothetical protein